MGRTSIKWKGDLLKEVEMFKVYKNSQQSANDINRILRLKRAEAKLLKEKHKKFSKDRIKLGRLIDSITRCIDDIRRSQND